MERKNKQIKYEPGPHPETGQMGYILLEDYVYYSKRYNRYKTTKKGTWSDGATGFIDLGSNKFLSRVWAWFRNRIHHLHGNIQSAWFFVHDEICVRPYWDIETIDECSDEGGHEWVHYDLHATCKHCGSLAIINKIDNWTASTVAADILWEAAYRFWSVPVWWATYLFGGGEARKNGMRRIKQ